MNAGTSIDDRIVLQPESTSEQQVRNLLMDAVTEHDAATLLWTTADLGDYSELHGKHAHRDEE
ncbi:hypothetical protein M0R89_22915 (plasmid) [Halorussus limi]|uniref:Uncharacterized protein n=1 Tax=Halorussus limi TaxID=2938695 RepID=A0A8U0I3N7_9EURY|nr:hypothetical protein [Halorussus limi]UPV77224.1 hypothetical protein M0R89_22915 [Halorussus limi]